MKDIPKISKVAVEEIIDFAVEKHEGQMRTQCNAADGSPIQYITHAREVERRIAFLLGKDRETRIVPIPDDEIDIVIYHPEVIKIIAFCHDLIEDCMSEQCSNNCPRNGQMHELCDSLFLALELKMKEYDIHPLLIIYILQGIHFLTKNHHLPKPMRDPDMWERISTAPFIIKLIKLSDNWHNLESISVRGLQKALLNYLKIRKSWEIIFTEEELGKLYCAYLIESPDALILKTKILEWMYECMFEDGDENSAELFEKYQYLVLRDNSLLKFRSPSSVFGNTRHRINTLCYPDISISVIEGKGDEQIFVLSRDPHETIFNLERTLLLGYDFFKMCLRETLHLENSTSLGLSRFNISDGGTSETIIDVLKALGMNGNDFIEKIDTAEKFENIVRDAIERLSIRHT